MGRTNLPLLDTSADSVMGAPGSEVLRMDGYDVTLVGLGLACCAEEFAAAVQEGLLGQDLLNAPAPPKVAGLLNTGALLSAVSAAAGPLNTAPAAAGPLNAAPAAAGLLNDEEAPNTAGPPNTTGPPNITGPLNAGQADDDADDADDVAERGAVLVVSGTVTEKLAPLVVAAYQALPEPRRVISFGSCANSGGPYWDSPRVITGVAELIHVDVFVPGCPPRPETLRDALRLLDGPPHETPPGASPPLDPPPPETTPETTPHTPRISSRSSGTTTPGGRGPLEQP